MINSVQATSERSRGRTRPERRAALWLSRLFALGWFWLWPLVHADGQSFGINPIDNQTVSVGTPMSIQVTITDSNIPPSLLNFTLASNRPTTDAANASIT